MKITLSRNEDISWYVEGHCLVVLKIFCILATVSLRRSSQARKLWSLDMRWGRWVWAWRWIMLELEGECFEEARNLRDLDGGWRGVVSFVGTSLGCFLVHWVGLTSTSSWENCWLDCIEASWIPMAFKVSPKTTTSSSAERMVWTREGVGVVFSMLNRKSCSEEGVLSLGHSIYHAHDWRCGKLHSCSWCAVNIWEGVAISVQIWKKKNHLGQHRQAPTHASST